MVIFLVIVVILKGVEKFCFWKQFYLFLPLRSWKAGRFERVPLIGNSHSFVTRGFRVSRAPPYHILPAFLNLHGTIIVIYSTQNQKHRQTVLIVFFSKNIHFRKFLYYDCQIFFYLLVKFSAPICTNRYISESKTEIVTCISWSILKHRKISLPRIKLRRASEFCKPYFYTFFNLANYLINSLGCRSHTYHWCHCIARLYLD